MLGSVLVSIGYGLSWRVALVVSLAWPVWLLHGKLHNVAYRLDYIVSNRKKRSAQITFTSDTDAALVVREPISGSGKVSWTNRETGSLAYSFDIGIEHSGIGTPNVTSLRIECFEGNTVTREILGALSETLEQMADGVTGQLYGELAISRLPKIEPGVRLEIGGYEFTVNDDLSATSVDQGTLRGISVSVPQGYTEEIIAELGRRRKARKSDDDYQRVAAIYQLARREGESAQLAVANEFGVGKERGAQLIAEARKRGFLPKTSKGKAT